MKNTRAFFLIVIGSFVIATGFAFAEAEISPYEQLVKEYNNRGTALGSLVEAAPAGTVQSTPSPDTTPILTPHAAVVTAVVPAVPAPKPDPAPTAGEMAKKFLKANMAVMVMAGVGAYLGMALLGPAGMVTGAVFMFALMFLGSL